jgi:hypothetical protein
MNRYLVDLTQSQGWLVAKQLADAKLHELDALAIECDGSDAEVARAARDAKSARRFWDNFLLSLENEKNPVPLSESFADVSY